MTPRDLARLQLWRERGAIVKLRAPALLPALQAKGATYGFRDGGCWALATVLVGAWDGLVLWDVTNLAGKRTEHVVAKVRGLDLYLDEHGARTGLQLRRWASGQPWEGAPPCWFGPLTSRLRPHSTWRAKKINAFPADAARVRAAWRTLDRAIRSAA